MTVSAGWLKTRRRLGGLAFLATFALLIWLSLAIYNKTFTPVSMVTLYTGNAGNEMNIGAQVMVRGVQVGEVRQITANGTGARLELAIDPAMVHLLPRNVTAQMLPTTLFGARYVDLVLPARPAAARLTAGSVISQDRSRDAIEIERVLNNLLPLLSATDPAQLSLTLNAISQGLQGRGTEIGQTLVQLNSYLRGLRPHLPALDRDIAELVKVSRTFTGAAPDIVQALHDFSVVSRTVYAQQGNLAALFSTVTTASDDIRIFLNGNSRNIIQLSSVSTGTLQLLARYSPEFPCTLRALVAAEPSINKLLGAGSSKPGLHVHLDVVPSLGRYLPGRNAPFYGDNLGPHCYPVPFRGITLNDGAGRAPEKKDSHPVTAEPRHPRAQPGAAPRRAHTASALLGSGTAAGAGLGLPGSPQESELVSELAALSLGRSPRSLPGWSGLLLAPLLRGTEVTVR
jgi:phospholipid/cholesterol/gamma-HCH transport system substrate-binding protein